MAGSSLVSVSICRPAAQPSTMVPRLSFQTDRQTDRHFFSYPYLAWIFCHSFTHHLQVTSITTLSHIAIWEHTKQHDVQVVSIQMGVIGHLRPLDTRSLTLILNGMIVIWLDHKVHIFRKITEFKHWLLAVHSARQVLSYKKKSQQGCNHVLHEKCICPHISFKTSGYSTCPLKTGRQDTGPVGTHTILSHKGGEHKDNLKRP